ncbi:MAG TPA: flagellar protein [Syntrophaceticus sp.]|nr:flagellar protein [Syntrophaceticus sp.]
MTEKIYFPEPILQPTPVRDKAVKDTGKGISFEEILKQQSLKFSAHARERIARRKIPLDANQLQRLNSAVEKAAAKGAKDSLILMDNLALIVSVKNRTVVTAIDENNIKGNVFTNIDSAVII